MVFFHMAISTNRENLPEKFRGIEQSFMEHLSVEDTASFRSFPKNTTFMGKESDENVILVVRSHWFRYIQYIVTSALVLILPTVVALLIPSLSGNATLLIAVFLTSVLLSMSLAMYSFLMWYYNVNIITDKRVIDLDFNSIFSHTSSEARLEKIEDVTSHQSGAFTNILDIGTVHIQTAGANAFIEFDDVPKPREIQDILSDLLELANKKEI